MRRALSVKVGREPPWEKAVYAEENLSKKTWGESHTPATGPEIPVQSNSAPFHSAGNELQAFALLWCLSHQSLKALFEHKSVQPHNLSERSSEGIAGSLPSLPPGQPPGRWEAEGRRQRLLNCHLTRYLDSSEEKEPLGIRLFWDTSSEVRDYRNTRVATTAFTALAFSLFRLNGVW